MNMKNLAMWAVIVFLTIGLYNMFKNPQANVGKGNSIIFSEFLSEVDNGGVVKVDIQGNNIKGVLANGNTFSTYSPNYPNLIEKLSERGVSISAAPLEDKMPSLFGVLLSWFPMLLLIAVWIFFMRQMQGGKGGSMGFGKSKAKLMNELKGKVTFDDVAGVEEAKEEVEEVVQFLKDPKKFSRLGGKIPRGCLLVGQPGTGKTLMARAVAAKTNATFLKLAGPQLVQMYIGDGARIVRDAFELAKAKAPCIIFIDELHTIVGAGGATGSLDASNIFKPALARGELQCIGASTLDEYRQHIEKDGALDRRFQKVLIEPPSAEEAIHILHNICSFSNKLI